MRPSWVGKDFKTVQSTTLTFTSKQAEQMRLTIRLRKNLQGATYRTLLAEL